MSASNYPFYVHMCVYYYVWVCLGTHRQARGSHLGCLFFTLRFITLDQLFHLNCLHTLIVLGLQQVYSYTQHEEKKIHWAIYQGEGSTGVPLHTRGGWRTTLRSWFSLSTIWVLSQRSNSGIQAYLEHLYPLSHLATPIPTFVHRFWGIWTQVLIPYS